jgi:Asp-tRNA(Asn)/Glu-tRNA(Gln) amidotransferase A subunit family amidase
MKGNSLGPLHGVPIGIKDIFDTNDYPTEFGSPIWAGRTPRYDAFAVSRLRADGAVILGKTVTTEYAYFLPARLAIRTTPTVRPAARRAAPRRRSLHSWCRVRSGARRMVR